MIPLTPRNTCREYFLRKNGKRRTFLLTKGTFDRLAKENSFSDGPYSESFGDSYGQPYNPKRQAFGTLKNGKLVYCELDSSLDKKVSLLERFIKGAEKRDKEGLEMIFANKENFADVLNSYATSLQKLIENKEWIGNPNDNPFLRLTQNEGEQIIAQVLEEGLGIGQNSN